MAEKENLEPTEDFAKMFLDSETANKTLAPGQKAKGVVIAISGDDVFLNIGMKEDGVMDRKELGDREINIGDEIEGFITSVSSQGVKLSKYMNGDNIQALEEARDTELPVEGKIKGARKGGYDVEIMGKTAFCPGSQLGVNGTPEELTGQKFAFLISRIENNGRNIVVSRRKLLDKEQRENLERFLERTKPGDIIEGRATRVAPFGVFVELAPGVEGLAHISQLAWSRVDNPEELFAPNDIVKVKFLGRETDDKGRDRLSLSVKQALDDPWSDIENKFAVDSIVEGKVVRLAPFGAFISLGDGVDGLAHISELSWDKKIRDASDALKIGEKVKVKIKGINKEDKKISLSVKEAENDPWADINEKFAEGREYQGTVESRGQFGIFVNLAPGVTGLIPNSVLKTSKDAGKYSRLNAGDPISVIVQKVDCPAKRISLIVEKTEAPSEDQSWKNHVKSEPTEQSFSSGIMAQALSRAFNKKQKGD